MENPTMWSIYIMEYYPAIQRKFLTHTTTYMSLEVMRQSHESETLWDPSSVGSQEESAPQRQKAKGRCQEVMATELWCFR